MKQDWEENSPFFGAVQCLAHRQPFNFLNSASPSSSELLYRLHLPNINAMKFLYDSGQPFEHQDHTEEFMPWCVYILLTTCFRNYLVLGRKYIWMSFLKSVFKRLDGHLMKRICTDIALPHRKGSRRLLLTPSCHPSSVLLFVSVLCAHLWWLVFLCTSAYTWPIMAAFKGWP